MARKKQPTILDALAELVSLLPWWAGLLLAVVSYFVLHAFAGQPTAFSIKPGDISGAMTSALGHAFATFGQYLIPLVCVVGAVMSAVNRRKRKTLAEDIAHSRSVDSLQGMSWREFEVLVGEGFRRQGYHVEERGGSGADGGIDLILRKDGEKFLVQCKQWKAFKVGVQIVRELYGAMAAEGAAGGFVVTSGRFTAEAKEMARGRNVTLLDGPLLHSMIRGARKVPAGSASRLAVDKTAGASSAVPPVCPLCSSAMVRRTAKVGSRAGSSFLGCSTYPKCRGTRDDISN